MTSILFICLISFVAEWNWKAAWKTIWLSKTKKDFENWITQSCAETEGHLLNLFTFIDRYNSNSINYFGNNYLYIYIFIYSVVWRSLLMHDHSIVQRYLSLCFTLFCVLLPFHHKSLKTCRGIEDSWKQIFKSEALILWITVFVLVFLPWLVKFWNFL